MNRLFSRLAAIVLVTAIVSSCDSANPLDPGGIPPDGTPPDETLLASITGTVMVGGAPHFGARVTLTGMGITLTTTSWTQGTFRFAGLPSGTYTLSAAPGSGFTCEPESAVVHAGQSASAILACVDLRGTVTGTLTAGGVPLRGVRIELSALGRTDLTDPEGAFTFPFVPPGDYTVSAFPSGTTCEPSSLPLEANQTVSVDIVCRPVGQISVAARTHEGLAVPATVTVSGPVRREAQLTWNNRILFEDLPPGEYTLTASDWLGDCRPVTTTLEVARVEILEILCDDFSEADIQGEWFVSLPAEDDFGEVLYSQIGDCPPLLTLWDQRRASIAFDSGRGRIFITGFDPVVTIVGEFPEARSLAGSGTLVRGDGSSIQSHLIGEVGIGDLNGGFGFFGYLSREHRSPNGGSVVCTEIYEVHGNTPPIG
jgi:hypothetical protein